MGEEDGPLGITKAGVKENGMEGFWKKGLKCTLRLRD